MTHAARTYEARARHAAEPVSPPARHYRVTASAAVPTRVGRTNQFATNVKGSPMVVKPSNPDRAVKVARTRERARATLRANSVPVAAAPRGQRPLPAMPAPPSQADSNATAVSVKLSPGSVSALSRASRTAELNMTDTINRAIQLYDYLLTATYGEGKGSVVIMRRGGASTQVHLR